MVAKYKIEVMRPQYYLVEIIAVDEDDAINNAIVMAESGEIQPLSIGEAAVETCEEIES